MASIFGDIPEFDTNITLTTEKPKQSKKKIDLFKLEVEKVFRREGGYVNDPNDSGGETIYGISKTHNPDAWLRGRPTKEQAEGIYRKNYWEAIKGDYLPPKVAAVLFDHAVLSGPSAAIEDLNRALSGAGGLGLDSRTIEAAWEKNQDELASEITSRRLERFDRIVAKHPEKLKFFRGWSSRAMGALTEAGAENDMIGEHRMIDSRKNSLLSYDESAIVTARKANSKTRSLNYGIKSQTLYQGRSLLEEKKQADEINPNRNDRQSNS
jgi:lysozyme family protein